jgi:hypothetical protein
MKTVLAIGVFVAVIFWSSDELNAVKCWGSEEDVVFRDDNGEKLLTLSHACLFNGTAEKTTEDNLRKQNCRQQDCPDLAVCGRREDVNKIKKTTEIYLLCIGTIAKCNKEENTDFTMTTCKCKKDLCNAGECKVEKKDDEIVTCEMGPPPTPKPDSNTDNGADGTSYTHLIIAFIVGAMFFH